MSQNNRNNDNNNNNNSHTITITKTNNKNIEHTCTCVTCQQQNEHPDNNGHSPPPSSSSSSSAAAARTYLPLEHQLKSLLKRHNGSTKHRDVRIVIDELVQYHNPTPCRLTARADLLVGDFVCHTIPEFPGRIKQRNSNNNNNNNNPHNHITNNNKSVPPSPSPNTKNDDNGNNIIQYTLGRLSFGVFQPSNLICTVRSVRQTIRVRNQSKTGVMQILDYPVLMDITVHAPHHKDDENDDDENENTTSSKMMDLPAILSHDAICYQDPKSANRDRFKVIFKGSTLMPSLQVLDDPQLLQAWKCTFQNAYSKAEKRRSLLSKTFHTVIAWWFQMTLPDDSDAVSNANSYRVHFEMKRPPRGHLDILYLSPTTRITKGNRGTIVVVEPIVLRNSERNDDDEHETNDSNGSKEHGEEKTEETRNNDVIPELQNQDNNINNDNNNHEHRHNNNGNHQDEMFYSIRYGDDDDDDDQEVKGCRHYHHIANNNGDGDDGSNSDGTIIHEVEV